jgi:divinyl protochlorophyllide a 8-vinyl-reductase
MSDGRRPARADLIGPNAILQYLPVLEAQLGVPGLGDLLSRAAIVEVPDGSQMIDEEQVARLHQAVRQQLPAQAPQLAEAAGAGTADYIIAHRIPTPIARILPVLPAGLAQRLLTRAIASHAWTFAGSGTFRVASHRPLTFEILNNPVVRGEHAEHPVCRWHAAVFARLFSRLVGPHYQVHETDCAACGDAACRFELRRLPESRGSPAA